MADGIGAGLGPLAGGYRLPYAVLPRASQSSQSSPVGRSTRVDASASPSSTAARKELGDHIKAFWQPLDDGPSLAEGRLFVLGADSASHRVARIALLSRLSSVADAEGRPLVIIERKKDAESLLEQTAEGCRTIAGKARRLAERPRRSDPDDISTPKDMFDAFQISLVAEDLIKALPTKPPPNPSAWFVRIAHLILSLPRDEVLGALPPALAELLLAPERLEMMLGAHVGPVGTPANSEFPAIDQGMVKLIAALADVEGEVSPAHYVMIAASAPLQSLLQPGLIDRWFPTGADAEQAFEREIRDACGAARKPLALVVAVTTPESLISDPVKAVNQDLQGARLLPKAPGGASALRARGAARSPRPTTPFLSMTSGREALRQVDRSIYQGTGLTGTLRLLGSFARDELEQIYPSRIGTPLQ